MGKAFKYGDHIDTDVIIPARYLNTSSAAELAEHCMEDIDMTFAASVEPGDVILAGENFGCGSSREHAPLSIKTAGVKCVIAKSFARIFFRNSFNIGMPIMICPEAVDASNAGDQFEVDVISGEIINKTTGKKYEAEPLPPFMIEMVEMGGLLNRLKSRGQ